MAVAVCLAAAAFTLAYLASAGLTPGPEYAIHGEMLVPALLFASGHGFNSLVDVPEHVRDFVEHKSESFSPDSFTEPQEMSPISGKFLLDRLYLIYAIGIIWRLLGISWWALDVLASIFVGVVAGLAYGLFRLGMGRILSLIGTLLFVTSCVTLVQIPALRDFCKAPFMLVTVFFLGCVITRRIAARNLVLLALVMGLLLGVGMGFRQDSGICVPPILVGLVLARGVQPLKWRFRAALPAVFLVFFLIPSWPVIKMNKDVGGNNAFYLTQGFSLPTLEQAGLERASYSALYSSSDQIVHCYVANYDDRTRDEGEASVRTALLARALAELPLNPVASVLDYSMAGSALGQADMYSKPAEFVARRLFRDLVWHFPADVVSRGYATILRVVGNLQNVEAHDDNRLLRFFNRAQAPLVRHFNTCGILYAAAGLLILAGADLRLGFGALILLLYFCGYPSLNFQVRHAFHMNFVSYWFAGFLLSLLWRNARAAIARLKGGEETLSAEGSGAGWRVVPTRLAIFLLASAALFWASLYPARIYQATTVDAMYARYLRADLEPLRASLIPREEGRVLCKPDTPVIERRGYFTGNVESEYMAIEFEMANPGAMLEIEYDGKNTDLCGQDVFRFRGPAVMRTVRYFFPVFDFSPEFQKRHGELGHYEFGTFRGISLPADAQFKALYRVRNRRDFPVPFSVWLPQDKRDFVGYYGL